MTASSSSPKPKARRGFAAMSQEKRSEIASRGGRAAQDRGTAHRFTTETGRAAGLKGGKNRPRKPSTTPTEPPTSTPNEEHAP